MQESNKITRKHILPVLQLALPLFFFGCLTLQTSPPRETACASTLLIQNQLAQEEKHGLQELWGNFSTLTGALNLKESIAVRAFILRLYCVQK